MKIKIYYGLSGALKGSTIKAEKDKDPNVKVMGSAIKPWKYYQFGVYKDRVEYNDLLYGLLHLTRLREFMEMNKDADNLIVERGITDSLFYNYHGVEFRDTLPSEEPAFIYDVVNEEKVLFPDSCEIKRVLLIQNDKKFVEEEVLKDEYRRRTFKNNPDLYFKLQNEYITFTTKYNGIDEVVRIDNAKDYIENTLGCVWDI